MYILYNKNQFEIYYFYGQKIIRDKFNKGRAKLWDTYKYQKKSNKRIYQNPIKKSIWYNRGGW